MMKNKVLVLLFLLAYPIYANAQNLMDKNNLFLIDSALNLIDMNRGDLFLLSEKNNPDNFRSPFIDGVYYNPLSAFDLVDFHKSKTKDFNEGIDDFCSNILRKINLTRFELYDFSASLPQNVINKKLNTNIDSAAPFLVARALTDYLNPVVQAISILEKDVISTNNSSKEFIINVIDSILTVQNNDNTNEFEKYQNNKNSNILMNEFLNKVSKFNGSNVYSLGVSLYKYIYGINDKNFKIRQMLVDNLKTTIINTKYGKIAIGGKGDDAYFGNYLMIIDIGGNDIYHFEAKNQNEINNYPIDIIIDFDGNDTYHSNGFYLGGTMFGISMLFDYNGNDIYTTKNNSLGAGIFGFGIFHDFAGNDKYFSQNFSLGAGAFGLGIFVDNSGNDSYYSAETSQGFGFVKGYGLLFDNAGNDVYNCLSSNSINYLNNGHFISLSQGAACGIYGMASGGIGVLFDNSGNDTYNADILSQGVGVWYSYGLLIDESGDDIYNSFKQSQGCGLKFGLGVLCDSKGNDTYISNSLSKGAGIDDSFGALLDLSGNDKYIAAESSLAASINNSISLFMDNSGSDSYSITNQFNCLGYSDKRDNLNGIALFIDAMDYDFYPEQSTNSINKTKSFSGAFCDLNYGTKPQDDNILKVNNEFKIANDKDSLFMQASTNAYFNKNMKKQAIDRFVELGANSYNLIIQKLNPLDELDELTLEQIFDKLIEKDRKEISNLLINQIRLNNTSNIKFVLKLIGKYKIKEALPILDTLLTSNDWQILASSIQIIGAMGEKSFLNKIMDFTKNDNIIVRAKAAYTVVQLSENNYNSILNLLEDKYQLVRNSTLNSLMDNKSDFSVIDFIFNSNLKEMVKLQFVPVLINCDYTPAEFKSLKDIIFSQNFSIRKTIYKAILEEKPKELMAQMKIYAKAEKNPELKSLIGIKKREK